jgi:hypothetical protein
LTTITPTKKSATRMKKIPGPLKTASFQPLGSSGVKLRGA